MRYYDIVIGNGAGGLNSLSSGGARFTSHPNGPSNPPDPGALNVEFDVTVVTHDLEPMLSWIRVWGISLQDISQSRNLNPSSDGATGLNILFYGGMGKGLPLANPSQAGLLFKGNIFQCYGNWIGTNMSLDIQVQPGTGRIPSGVENRPQPVNLSWTWKAGTPMSQAIGQTLTAAFPSYKQDIQISADLTRPNDEVGVYGSLTQFARYVLDLSRAVKNDPKYQGVQILLWNDTLTVRDGTQQQSSTKKIQFTDLIGQPTWINLQTIQVTCAMRSDIRPTDNITLPPGLVTTGQNSFSQFRQQSAFQGTFNVIRTHHVGNLRQPDAVAWVTVIDAIVNPATPSASTTTPAPPGGNVTIENLQTFQ